MLHRPRAALLAALLSLLTAASALAQGFPATMGPNTVYGRLGVSQGPGQAITFTQLRTALGFLPGTGTVSSVGCGNGLSGGTITGTGSCAVIFGTDANTAAQGNDPRILGALQGANNLSDVGSAATSRTNLGLGTMATQAASAVAITGGTITGLPACAASTDACPKSYIDLLALGFRTLPEVRLASAAVLPNTPTYANGTAGVGATLTAGANAALTVDSTAVVSGDAILVKDQVSTTGCTVANAGCQNGIYTVTTVGDGSNAWVLTRRTDFDTAAEMLSGSVFAVSAGSTNVGRAYNLQSTVTTVGTTPATFNLLFVQSQQWVTSGSDAYRATGNIGINAAPAAWDSAYKVFQAGNGAFGTTGNVPEVLGNIRWDGSNFKYLATDTAALFAANVGGAFAWYTAPSGTAGNSATVTQRMNLGNTGTLRLLAYGAGVSTFDSSGNFVSKPSYSSSIIYAADYGCLAANSRGDNDTNCQAAIDAAIAAGTVLQFPGGIIQTSAQFTCNNTITLRGTGMGKTGASSNLGTIIDSNKSSGNVFFCKTYESVQFQDMTIQLPVSTSTATGIKIETANLALTGCNIGSRINNVSLRGGGTGIYLHAACNFSVTNSYIIDPSTNCIEVSTNGNGLADLGDSWIAGNTCWAAAVTGTNAGFYIDSASALQIIGNKVLGYPYSIWLNAKDTSVGTLLISNNSLEQFTASCFLVSQSASGKTFAYVNFSNNQCQSATSTYQSAVTVSAGAANFVSQMIVSNNMINLTSTVYSGAIGVGIGDANFVNVHDNIVNMNSTTAAIAYATYGNATNVQFGNNQATGYTTRYSCGVAAKVLDATSAVSWGNC